MQLGKHLRELWRLRIGVALSAILAVVVAVSSIGSITLSPPGVKDRKLEIAGASTHVLVDLQQSTVTDLHANAGTFGDLTVRASLLGNVMASLPVREYIGRAAGIDPSKIEAVAPVTISVPRAMTEPGSEKRTSDILRSTDQYRLDIQANPTVPILDIYAQAPSTDAAVRLANGAVAGLRTYLDDLAARQRTKESQEVRLVQLGAAQGGVINGGVKLQVAMLSFLVVFVMACCALVLSTRVRRGWIEARNGEREETLRAAALAPVDAPKLS